MSEVLILQSRHGKVLTDQLIDTYFDANEMFIVKKIFSDDRSSVEVTFSDEERAEMMADLLKTCYADSLLITRPEPPTPLDSSIIDDERETSPVHMSSSASVTSSKRSVFSQRLLAFDKTKAQQAPEEKMKLAVGRGRGLEQNFSPRDTIDDQDRLRPHSPTPSTSSTIVSSVFGRGRAAPHN